jgi:hypothetical protein
MRGTIALLWTRPGSRAGALAFEFMHPTGAVAVGSWGSPRLSHNPGADVEATEALRSVLASAAHVRQCVSSWPATSDSGRSKLRLDEEQRRRILNSMKGMRLEPARGLLDNFDYAELSRLLKRSRPDVAIPRSRAVLINLITRHLDVDAVVEQIRSLFPARRVTKSAKGAVRLDDLPPLHGSATVQAYLRSRPQLGRALLARPADCVALSFNSAPLFLENRWPVVVRDAGLVKRSLLYAAYVRPGRVHPAAEALPPKTKPYLLDEGEYQLRNGRLRFELAHAGPISFQVTFLRGRPPAGRPEYLFEPIV